MTDSHVGNSTTLEQTPAHQNIMGESPLNTNQNVVPEAADEAQGKAVRDQVDEAAAEAPKKTDELHPGTVQVAETGDLHDLAARRRSS